jgi:hypothetical protein
MRTLAAALAIAVICSTAAPAALPANEKPLADAGLDQTVRKHTTVHLDATGSRDPDGSIASYDWTIQTPTGANTTPDCATCARTSFTPSTVGTYRVTLTVTDDDGATATDTLYVTVTPGEPPEISVTGPTSTRAGTPATYTATLTAGGAPLDTITWHVDGTTVSTSTISGNDTTADLHHTFGTPGSHTVSATVTDTDGATATDTLRVTVHPDRTPPNATPHRSYADRDTPIVDGPRVVTGSQPLDATYTLQSDTGHVKSITWWRDSRSVAIGDTHHTTWLPGQHTLYATITYTDGSRTAARFPDGSTLVEADPKPGVSLTDLDTRGRIAGLASATDDFDNLRELTVTIDGEQVASESITPAELRSSDDGSKLRLPFEFTDVTPEEPHRVTVQARDARGQETTLTRTVTPTGTPEIVSSEFVNGPVDSYHPKLDPERYAAHHVLKIDLNGVDPEKVSVNYSLENDEDIVSFNKKSVSDRKYEKYENALIIHSYWAADSPGFYDVASEVSVTDEGKQTSRSINIFSVTPSKPEIRVDVVADGTPFDKNNWGIVVNASESFDPDGTDLKYIWGGGAQAIANDNSTAKFDSMQVGTLKVRDGDGQTAVFRSDLFLYYYTPEIESVTELSNAPYRPNETVIFELRTESFRLPKNQYYDDFDVKVAPTANAQVLRWEKRTIENTTDISNREQRYYTGTIEIPASALENSSKPPLSIYNTGAPDKSGTHVTLPSVQVLERGDRTVENVTIVNTSYLVEKPTAKYVSTAHRSMVEDYESQGYTLVESSWTGTRYNLEKRVKIQDAEYRTETRRFDSRGYRNTFLDRNPDWNRGSTETETRNWTTTQREWRNTQNGNGTFTGETRRVKTEPAEYRTKRQYRYEYQVQRTGTRTVRRTKTYRVPVTKYRWVTECNYYGCYRTREAYTVWEIRTDQYQTQEEYQYTVTKTDTYWSFRKRSPDDEYTGRSNRVEVESAEYETQYQYEYQVDHQETTRYYTATRDVVVQPAEYEWKEYKTTRSKTVAETAITDADRRIGSEEPAKRWKLRKQTGTQQEWTNDAESSDTVVKTRATVTYTVHQEWAGDGEIESQKQEKTKQVMLIGYQVNSEIISEIRGQKDEDGQEGIV